MDKLINAQKDGVVIGLKDVTGSIVPRQDIDTLLFNEPDAFNVFIIALWELQNDSQSAEKMSYYQIAGIHGLPKAYWDGVVHPQKSSNNTNYSGYCHHGVLTFGPWHRPYLALLEQTIYNKMVEVVERYPQDKRPKYRQAIKRWRLPYWDYLHPRGGQVEFPGIIDDGRRTSFDYNFNIPQIFTLEQVMIRTTEADELKLHPNPLNFYTFPKAGRPERIPDTQWNIIGTEAGFYDKNRTWRYRGNVENLNSKLNMVREGRTGIALQFMNAPVYGNWRTFGSQSRTPGASGSLEDVHGSYHWDISGPPGGHMREVPVAAFDPVFWQHHCQIDRWLAIWQALNPNAWFSSNDPMSKSNLLPFRNSKTPQTFWTSDLSRKTETFGYTYPDLIPGTSSRIRAEFNRRYEWSTRPNGQVNFGPVPADMKPLEVKRAQVYQFNSASGGSPPFQRFAVSRMAGNIIDAAAPIAQKVMQVANTAAERVVPATAEKQETGLPKKEQPKQESAKADQAQIAKQRVFTNMPEGVTTKATGAPIKEGTIAYSWYLDQVVERLALNGTFATYFFIGAFEDEPEHYDFQPTLAGEAVVFAAPVEACDNCGNQEEQALLVTSTTDITPILLDYKKVGRLQSLSAEHVEPFLKENLKWRVLTATARKVDPRSVRGLKLGVSSKTSPIPPATGEIVYREYPQVIEHIIASSS